MLTGNDFLAQGAGNDGSHVEMESNEPRLHPRHIRHHRQAQARRPRPRRLSGRHSQHGQVVLRSPRHRCLVVNLRHRLGRRALLHRLCASSGGRNYHRLRGCNQPPYARCHLADNRRVRSNRHVHLAHRSASAHALWRRGQAQDKTAFAGARLLRRRGAEPARVGLAAERGARRQNSGHRPLLADRDRRPPCRQPIRLGDAPHQAGSSGTPMPGIEAAIMTPEGEPCATGEKGILVITRPFPSLTPTLWGEPDRYGEDYWGRIPDQQVYFTGDSAHMDEDGYIWFPAAPMKSSILQPTASAQSRSSPRSSHIPQSQKRA